MKKKRWARAAQAGKHLGSCPILHMNGFAINRVTLKRRQGAIMTRAIRVNTGNSWAILRDIILRNTASRSESYITPIKGFEFHRQVSNADPKPHFYEPVIIVVVQGKKLVKIGAIMVRTSVLCVVWTCRSPAASWKPVKKHPTCPCR